MDYEINLCEDDPVQNEKLIDWLRARFPEGAIHGFTDENALIAHIQTMRIPRIVLMDIMLKNDVSGIETAKTIKKIDPSCILVFLSSYLEKACDVYEVDHCYFVYKPQKETRLEAAMQKAVGLLKSRPKEIIAHTGTSTIRLDPDRVLYLERIKRYTLVYCRTETIKVKEDLETLIRQLPDSFHRCHRSFVVNFRYVRSYMVHDLKMDDGKLLSVSRGYIQPIKTAFHRYLTDPKEGIL
ncbi:LytTR family DNA-binding domain-containing protein [uncultured Dubosiella sp.]|uniref:LytR/AlgR family response regulator transcription factor n=1 Tax=uncultured Dubosiella sp. TaxID=1937011 RepID=UPI0025975984|nr:LytTR family DNA-binding domain-containing protein [uncultured Dubosiella sp.]